MALFGCRVGTVGHNFAVAKRPRTYPPVGAFLQQVRLSRRLQGKEIAERSGMRPAQVTHLQQGGNALWEYYDSFAKACGFKTALDMFTTGGDSQVARLLRLWKALPDDAARMAALRAVKQLVDADEESSAT